MAISGNGGTIKERRQFDAWGNLKKHYKNEVLTPPSGVGGIDFELLTDRGYTAHEHFFSVGIIHMNARLYDPVLHTFLSPDANITDPSNPQNYNRYAYALNNPLMYVDYSGNDPTLAAILITAAIIGAGVAAYVYVSMSLANGTAITWGGLAKSIIVGAISGAASGGIGEIIKGAGAAICAATQTLTQTQINILLAVPQALMHGIAQGIIQGVSGGDVGQSFIVAAISSLAGSGFSFDGNGAAEGLGWANSVRGSITGQSLFGSVVGGLTSHFQKGNFWEGAAIGLTVALLNHAGEKLYPAIDNLISKKYKLHVLEDYEAANGAGHQALVGDVDGDLLYVSKDGTNENNGVYGEAKNTIRRFVSFKDIDEFYSTRVSPGKHYDSRLTFKVTKAQMQTALNTAIRLAQMPYNLFNNSCTTIVQFALTSAGIFNYKNYSTIPNESYKTMSKLPYKPAY